MLFYEVALPLGLIAYVPECLIGIVLRDCRLLQVLPEVQEGILQEIEFLERIPLTVWTRLGVLCHDTAIALRHSVLQGAMGYSWAHGGQHFYNIGGNAVGPLANGSVEESISWLKSLDTPPPPGVARQAFLLLRAGFGENAVKEAITMLKECSFSAYFSEKMHASTANVAKYHPEYAPEQLCNRAFVHLLRLGCKFSSNPAKKSIFSSPVLDLCVPFLSFKFGVSVAGRFCPISVLWSTHFGWYLVTLLQGNCCPTPRIWRPQSSSGGRRRIHRLRQRQPQKITGRHLFLAVKMKKLALHNNAHAGVSRPLSRQKVMALHGAEVGTTFRHSQTHLRAASGDRPFRTTRRSGKCVGGGASFSGKLFRMDEATGSQSTPSSMLISQCKLKHEDLQRLQKLFQADFLTPAILRGRHEESPALPCSSRWSSFHRSAAEQPASRIRVHRYGIDGNEGVSRTGGLQKMRCSTSRTRRVQEDGFGSSRPC